MTNKQKQSKPTPFNPANHIWKDGEEAAAEAACRKDLIRCIRSEKQDD